MLCSTKELKGFTLAARDGDIGQVRAVYFDDQHWAIRHVVVDTGGWLSGRDVLISPHSIERLDPARRRLDVALSRRQVKDAPDIDTDKPVSRQQEIPYYDYYGYPYYWVGTGLWGVAAYPMGGLAPTASSSDASPSSDTPEAAVAKRETADPHLRSSAEVTGYGIEAIDGDIGHIDDFLFDDRSWQIRHAVVDTRNWLPGKLVLVSPQWITSVDWDRRRVHVKVTRDALKASPPYELAVLYEYKQQVQGHYGEQR